MALAGGVVVGSLIVLALAGPYVTAWSATAIDYSAPYAGPSASHWWGTDAVGHDVFAQSVHGLRRSLLIGLAVAVSSTALSALVGACAGYFGGWADRVLMFVVDLLLVLPAFLVVAILSARLRSTGWAGPAVVIALLDWMIAARVIRSMAVSLRDADFVRAARMLGTGSLSVIRRHIVPNIASYLIVDVATGVCGAVLAETALSYFGFGVQPPDVSLGTLISTGSPDVLTYPWVFLFPAGLLVVFVLAVNLVGDGLREALDPCGHATGTQVATRTKRTNAVLEIRDLTVSFNTGEVVRGVDLTLNRGEVLGLVGESGSGKSMTLLAAMGLPPRAATVRGSVRLGGTEIVGAPDRTLAALRGNRISIVFQDALAALSPVQRVGDQIAETIRIHQGLSRRHARERAVELLGLVGFPDPRRGAAALPDELSGGMRRRVLIAMAIANDPDVILADEPTTGLDAIVRAQILDLLRTVRRRTGAAMVLVSHDLDAVAELADRVAVMRAGRLTYERSAMPSRS